MNNYFKFLFREPQKNIVLMQLRQRLLKMMLFSSFLIGTALYLIALISVL